MSFIIRHKWLNLISIFMILALGIALVVTVRSIAKATGGSIVLSTSSGPPTTALTVTGTGFGASETVALSFDTSQVSTANTDATGAFSTNITIPTTASPAAHSIGAVGQTSGISAQAPFTVRTDWNQLGFDTQHSHFNPYENVLSTANVSNLASYWKASALSGIYSEPVVANGIAYVTTRTGYLQAFDAVKGTQLWKFIAPNPYSFGDDSVAIANGVVYAASGINSGPSKGSRVDAFNATTGANLWTTPLTGFGISTSPTVANGVVYVSTADHGLYALNASSGAIKWIAAVSGITSSPSAVSSLDGSGNPTGSLYAGTTSTHNGVPTNHLSVIDIATGAAPSSFFTAGTVAAQAVVNGKLYVSMQGGTTTGTNGCYAASSVCAFDLTTSKRLWMYTDPAGYGYSSVSVANNVVYVNSGSASAGSGTITALDATAGTVLWNTTTGGQSTDLSVANGVLYATFSDKTVKAFDISTGTQLWSASDPLGFGDGVAVVNGVVYVGSGSTAIDAFYVYVPDSNAAIKLSATAGPPETIVTVNGTGFGANEAITLTFNGTQASATTDGTGAFSGTITVPIDTAPGSYAIQATGQSSGSVAQANFLVQTSWSMFGADTQHTHVNPYENVLTNANVANLKVHWQVPTGGYVYTSAAVANGIAYVGSIDQNMYAINTTTGKVLWHYNTGGAIYSSPAVVNGIVYFGSNVIDKNNNTIGKLIALKADSGGKVWAVGIAAPYSSSPVVINDTVYIGTDAGKLSAFNALTGAVKWSATIAGSLRSSPAIANGVVYVGSNNHKLYAYDATTGAALWSYVSGSSILSSPSVVNNVVYFGSNDGRCYAVNAATGKLIWAAKTGNQINSSPAVVNGVVYIGSYDHKLYAFNATTGATLWTYTTGNSINSSPTVANGVVYVGSYDHKLYALDATSGTLLWSYTTNGVINSSPAVVDGIVYVGSYDHNMYAFSLT